MSSLTDIVFLLLIFFMLTSNVVSPSAINLMLPRSSRSPVSKPDKDDQMSLKIDRSKKIIFLGREVDLKSFKAQFENEIKKKGTRERASSDFFTKTTRPERPAFWRSKRSTSVIFAATSAEH